MTTICCISDTHSQHSLLTIPKCDILLHGGDFSRMGSVGDTKAFMEWFSKQPATHKIFISGNHDFLDQREPVLFKELLREFPDIKYLRDEGCEVEGLNIWGRPWVPEFCGWAFMADPGSPKMLSSLSIIPSNVDILLTHGPARGILDNTKRGEKVGCEDLLNELERIKPKYMVFGHIHESSGYLEVNNTTHINASTLNEHYQFKNKPIIIEI